MLTQQFPIQSRQLESNRVGCHCTLNSLILGFSTCHDVILVFCLQQVPENLCKASGLLDLMTLATKFLRKTQQLCVLNP